MTVMQAAVGTLGAIGRGTLTEGKSGMLVGRRLTNGITRSPMVDWRKIHSFSRPDHAPNVDFEGEPGGVPTPEEMFGRVVDLTR